jgi:hypothetical protein
MDNTLKVVLAAADGDLTALVDAVVHVVEERHYNQRGAQEEAERVVAYLREAVGGDEAKARWARPRLVLAGMDAA